LPFSVDDVARHVMNQIACARARQGLAFTAEFVYVPKNVGDDFYVVVFTYAHPKWLDTLQDEDWKTVQR
jgi:hypothetical protein